MFERIRAYKNIKKMENAIRGTLALGELLDDKEIIQSAQNTLRYSAKLKRLIWTNRKIAKRYNLEASIHGF